MANFYKNAFYDPTVTTAVAVYTCPANANAIIQNIQVTNESGSKVLKSSILLMILQPLRIKLLMQVLVGLRFVILLKVLLY
jgi:hypothetical protein